MIEEESIHSIFDIRGVDCELSDGCDVFEEVEVFFMGFPARGVVVVEKSAVACVVMLLLGGHVAGRLLSSGLGGVLKGFVLVTTTGRIVSLLYVCN